MPITDMEVYVLRRTPTSPGWSLKYPFIFGSLAAAGVGFWWFFMRTRTPSMIEREQRPRGKRSKQPIKVHLNERPATSASSLRPAPSKIRSPSTPTTPPASPSPPPEPVTKSAANKLDEIRKLFVEIERLKQTGQFSKAIDLTRKLIPMVEAHFGPYTKNTFNAHQILFEALLHVDRLSEAEAIARKSLDIARKLPAPDNEQLVARVLAHLGDLLHQLNRSREAIPFSQEALEMYQKLDDQSERLGVVSWNLGLALAKIGKYEDAELNIRRAVVVLSDDTKLNITCKLSLVGVLFDCGKMAEAQTTYAELLDQLFISNSPEMDFFVPFVRLVQRALLDRKLTQLASALLDRALKVVEANENVRDLAVIFYSDLVGVRREEEKEAEAEQLEQQKVLPALKLQQKILPPLTSSKYLRAMHATIKTQSANRGEYCLTLAFRESLPLPQEPDASTARVPPGSKLLFEFQNPSDVSHPLQRDSEVSREVTIGTHLIEYKSEAAEGFVPGDIYQCTIRVMSPENQLLGVHRQFFRYLPVK